MELKHNKPGDEVPDNIDALGNTVTNFITLQELPPDFAATKRYVDATFFGLDITPQNVVITAASVVGAFSGDLVAGAGNTARLIPRITAGTYPAVTVNSKGLVTAGGSITNNEIPFISWTKITTDLPTTAAGYGITDGLLTTGGALTGNLSLNADPTATAHAATKGYVDTLAAAPADTGVATGDIIYKLTGGSYPGFLICNGSDLNRVTYADLFAVVGTQFNVSVTPGAYVGSGKPWVDQYEFNFTQTAALGAWSTYTAMPATVYISNAIVTKSRVYMLGGLINGSWSATVYTAPINADGTLGSWTTSAVMPATVGYAQAVAVSGGSEATSRVYVLAGQMASAESAAVYTAPINTDGTLGTWSTAAFIPSNLRNSQAIQTKSRLYLIGGQTAGVAQNKIHSAPVNSDGSLGIWVTHTDLPVTVYFSQSVVIKDKVYILGGLINGALSSAVYRATIDSDGFIGTWSLTTALPVTWGYGQALVVNARLYIIGGQINSTMSSAIYSAPIDANGDIGTWTLGTALPGTLYYSAIIATSSKLYTLGGVVNGAASNVVYTTSFTGGQNDYSPMYGGGYIATNVTDFRLPDLTSLANNGMSHYIKF